MAFTQDTFASVGAHSADTPSLYSYKSDDTTAELEVAGYFADKSSQLEEGDRIEAFLSDGNETLVIDANGDAVSVSGGSHPDFDSVANRQIPVKEEVGDAYEDSGGRVNFNTGAWTIDADVDVTGTLTSTQASLEISPTISISQATSDIIVNTPLQVGQSEIVRAPYRTSTGSISGPQWLQLSPTATRTVEADDTQTITTNPLLYTQNNGENEHRTQLVFKTSAAMSNVRMLVTDRLSGDVIKYIPSKAICEAGVGGFDFIAGTNTIFLNREGTDGAGEYFMKITPMRLRGLRDGDWEIQATTMALLGSAGDTPFLDVEANPTIVREVLSGDEINSALIPGSIMFVSDDLGLLSQDNPNLFWDAANGRLGILTNTPRTPLDVGGPITFNAVSDAQESAFSSVLAQAIFNTARNALRVETSDGFTYASYPKGNVIYARVSVDLPVAAGGVITIPAGVTVSVEEDIDIGTDIISLLAGSSVKGVSQFSTTLSGSSASGVIKAVDPALGAGLIENISIMNNTPSSIAMSVGSGDSLVTRNVNIKNKGIYDIGEFDIVDLTGCSFMDDARIRFSTSSPDGSAILSENAFTQTVGVNSIEVSTGVIVDDLQASQNVFSTVAGGSAIALVGTGSVSRGSLKLGRVTGLGATTVGFDQTSDEWTFEDVQGLIGSCDQGSSSWSGAATTIDLAAAQVWRPIDDGGTIINYALSVGAQKFSLNSGDTGGLIYNGVRNNCYKSSASVIFERTLGTNIQVQFGVSINGATPTSESIVEYTAGIIFSTAILPISVNDLTGGDIVELRVRNVDGANPSNDIDVKRVSFTTIE